MEEKENANKKGKRALLTAGVALFAALSLTVSGLFQSPGDLLHDDDSPTVIVADDADPDTDGGGDGDGVEDTETEKQRRGGFRKLLRARILSMPVAVRMLVVLPLWLAGSGLTLLGTALWSGVSPILSHILNSLLLILALFAAFVLAAKAIFPDLPLKKILNRRTIPRLLLLGVILSIADRLLLAFVAEYASVRNIAVLIAFLLALFAAVLAFALRELNRGRRAAEKAQAQQSPKPERDTEDLVIDIPGSSVTIRRDAASARTGGAR